MRGTWQTTDSGGSGLGQAVVIVGAAALIASVAGPVAAAVAGVIEAVLVVLAVIVGLAVAGGLALVAYRVRGRRANTVPPGIIHAPPPARPVQARTVPRAIERREVHLHFHGVTAEDVAAIIERQQEC
jgi:hypothetical protein